jgi:MYXO-CTERM domain-containing protein
MRLVPFLAAALALTAAGPERAEACGGCFVPPATNTQVTGHRMIFSVSAEQTTLYDQIEYAGAPESFAWILPIQGQVEVGLSSDGLFSALDQATQNVVFAPPVACPVPEGCYTGGFGANSSLGGDDVESAPPPVTVISQEVVGPYETVQLTSTDPQALRSWLESRGYDLPAEIEPVIDAYVAEGFSFLAMKLVPGQGVSAMRPVRITAPGAGLSLPLRMVAAGTGAYTPIVLFVVAEGRYAPSNFPSYEVDRSKVGFSFGTLTSNLPELEEQGREQFGENAWLTASSFPNPNNVFSPVEGIIQNEPTSSGYGDPLTGDGALEEFVEDLNVLYGGMSVPDVWFTRLYANLPRQSLAQDLFLGAAAQEELSPVINATYWLGEPPPCPDFSWCQTIAPADVGLGGGWTCALSAEPGQAWHTGLVGLVALAGAVRRRNRHRFPR